jgi:ABC-type bacteriocin/lantibiotic exporter with double-glycine peptidase domain
MAAGGLAACVLLVGRVMQPLNNILSAFNRWSMLNIIREQLDTVLRMPIDNKERVSGFDELQGEITFRNMSFYFEEKGSPWILNDITLTIAPRTVVSIIGHDQTAKTALFNILATITKPTSGEYLLDGKNVDFFQTYEIREKIAYLTKTGKLFHGTMMENLSAFQEELIPTARRFVDALGLNKIIAKLPSGYSTTVGDKAVECLPGGVINLILIIRALVTKPKIILLDETNMSLDTQATQKMIELLKTLKEVSTIIILSSSADTVALSNAVYDLKDGKLYQEPHAK